MSDKEMIFSEEDQAFLDSLPDDDTIEPMTDEEKEAELQAELEKFKDNPMFMRWIIEEYDGTGIYDYKVITPRKE